LVSIANKSAIITSDGIITDRNVMASNK